MGALKGTQGGFIAGLCREVSSVGWALSSCVRLPLGRGVVTYP